MPLEAEPGGEVVLPQQVRATWIALNEIRPFVRPALKAIDDLREKGFPPETKEEFQALHAAVSRLDNRLEMNALLEAPASHQVIVADFSLLESIAAATRLPFLVKIALRRHETRQKAKLQKMLDLEAAVKTQMAVNAVDLVVQKSKSLEIKVRRHPKFDTPTFKCISDNVKCMDGYGSRSAIYKGFCALAFGACIAKQLIPFTKG
ncbi:hypothetical protein ACFPYM_00715 [Methylobacterium hispanicum]|uniref:hypothetical protein n=1 Tax=Methylobacterium hispanicum TaxID=270350 RepID=UPI001EDD330D|nr:hypothetical protein [Methylobacterium hispanicum]